MPVGTIVSWWDAGNSPVPPGKLLCDGQAFSPTTYPALAAHLGVSNTPDLRGRFLRGADDVFANGTTGGSNVSSLPEHTHGLSDHTHSINHDHPSRVSTSSGSHKHSINHDHASVTATTAGAGSHNHAYVDRSNTLASGSTGKPMRSNNSGTDSWQATESVGNHTHTVNVNLPNYSGNSGSAGSHTHSVDVAAFSGSSGIPSKSETDSSGSSHSHANLPPFVGVNFLIQAE